MSMLVSTPPTLVFEGQRATSDLLEAERALRAQSESDVRALRGLLLDVAVRLDGERLESVRRDDPSVPGAWSVEQWRVFLRDIPAANGWGEAKPRAKQADRESAKRIKALEEQLEELQREITVQRERADRLAASVTVGTSASVTVGASRDGDATTANEPAPFVEFIPPLEGAAPPLTTIIADAKRQAAKCPAKIPQMAKAMNGGARVGGDLERARQRAWLALYIVGRWKVCASLEIDEAMSGVTGVSAGSGSLRRITADLIESQLLIGDTLELKSPHTSLRVVRLSDKGVELYRQLFGTAPEESDWSRMIRLHEGETQREHTLAVLSFAMHARKRGYATRVLPDVDGNAAPDVWIGRGDEQLYVEVELQTKERVAKWRNLAALNGGKIALCAAAERARQRLVGDCKLDKIASGAATDMEMLIAGKFRAVDESTPLWVETW